MGLKRDRDDFFIRVIEKNEQKHKTKIKIKTVVEQMPVNYPVYKNKNEENYHRKQKLKIKKQINKNKFQSIFSFLKKYKTLDNIDFFAGRDQ